MADCASFDTNERLASGCSSDRTGSQYPATVFTGHALPVNSFEDDGLIEIVTGFEMASLLIGT